jgi:O-antigen ligase
MTDYLFWSMMLTINAPNLLQVWGIDTIFKPYRMISLLLLLLAIPQIMRQTHKTLQFSLPLFFAIGYATFVTGLFAGSSAFDQFPLLITGLALFFSPFVLSSRRSLIIGLYAFLISFAISAAFGFIALRTGRYRMSGLFENPNSFGLGACFAIIIILNGYLRIPNWIRIPAVVATFPVLFLTGSRGTLIGAAGGLFAQLWRNPALFRSLMVCSVLAASAAFFFDEKLQGFLENQALYRITKLDIVERGAEGRLAQMRAGMIVGAEHGFIGIGLGQYREKHHTRFFFRRGLDGEISKLNLHSLYMTLLVEWGLVGFVAFGVILVRLVKMSKGLKYEKDFIFSFLGISLLNGLGNNLLGEIHFWLMLSICVQFIRFSDPVAALQSRRFVAKPTLGSPRPVLQ